MASRRSPGTRLPIPLRGVISTASSGTSSGDGAVDSVNGQTGVVTISTVLISNVALAGAVPTGVSLGWNRATGVLYGPDAGNDWQPLTASTPPNTTFVAGAVDADALLAGLPDGVAMHFQVTLGGASFTSANPFGLIVDGDATGGNPSPLPLPEKVQGYLSRSGATVTVVYATGASDLMFDTRAEFPNANTGNAGRKAIATNDGADTGLYIATGPVGGPGQSWQKVGP